MCKARGVTPKRGKGLQSIDSKGTERNACLTFQVSSLPYKALRKPGLSGEYWRSEVDFARKLSSD